MSLQTRPTPPHLTSAMAENILAAACESETRKAAKRMRLEIYQTSQVRHWQLEVGKEQNWQCPVLGSKVFQKVLGAAEQNAVVCRASGDGNAGLDWPHCRHRAPGIPALSCWQQRTAKLLAGLGLCFPCAGRTDRSRQAALQRLHSHHPLLLLTASFILLPRPSLHQWKPELQLPWLRVPGGQPAAPRIPPDGQPQ